MLFYQLYRLHISLKIAHKLFFVLNYYDLRILEKGYVCTLYIIPINVENKKYIRICFLKNFSLTLRNNSFYNFALHHPGDCPALFLYFRTLDSGS